MANPLDPLDPSLTFNDIRAACARLPEEPPEVDLTRVLDLRLRSEHIFVAARGMGKTTLLRQLGLDKTPPIVAPPEPLKAPERCYGVYDDNGQHTDMEIVRIIQSMIRFGAAQLHYLPGYKPIVLLRATTWHRIASSLSYVRPQFIAHIAFPRDYYVEQLLRCNIPIEAVGGYFGERWSRQFWDGNGEFMPSCAWAATRTIGIDARCTSPVPAKNRAVCIAGAQHLQHYYPDLMKHIMYVAPSTARYRLNGAKVYMDTKRVEARLRLAARKMPLPNKMSKPDWIRYLEVAGIWKKERTGWVTFAPPYGSGASYLKHELQLKTLSGS